MDLLSDVLRAIRMRAAVSFTSHLEGDWAIQSPEPGEISIAEVAARVGFDSTVAFHRAFKRRVGRTPEEWRTDHTAR